MNISGWYSNIFKSLKKNSKDYIFVDEKYNFEKEKDFDSNNIKWKFYGDPYGDPCNIDFLTNSVKKYGFNYSFGYIELIEDSNIKFDVYSGLLIKRLDSRYDYDSD